MNMQQIFKSAPAEINPTVDDPHGLIGAWPPKDEKAATLRREYRNKVAAQLLREKETR